MLAQYQIARSWTQTLHRFILLFQHPTHWSMHAAPQHKVV
jgi:hypothetical protein